MPIDKSISNLREDYQKSTLEITDVSQKPIQQFQTWFDEARKAEVLEPNAMTLSTINEEDRPSSRIVLLKSLDERGFVFFTNYKSDKGQQLEKNPFAALTFVWLDLQRQVRVEGKVEKISKEESDTYFNSRPRKSRIGAWTSPQSEVIPNREFLDQQEKHFQEKFEGKEPPRPPHWGGFRIVPDCVEFWQGRSSRLHDRLRYTLQKDNSWKIERLAP